MPDRIRLDGRVAVVTGAAGVIGTATIRLLAERGARIVAIDRKEDDLKAAIKDLPASAEALAVTADVTQEDEVADYVRATVDRFGTIDAFYNNAGIEGDIKPIPEYSLESFRRVLDVNVVGVFLGMKHVLPVMLKQNKGSIINTASIAGLIGSPMIAVYSASKHAVIGLTKTAAWECTGTGVRVNCVCPGLIDSRMLSTILQGRNPGNDAAAEREDRRPDSGAAARTGVRSRLRRGVPRLRRGELRLRLRLYRGRRPHRRLSFQSTHEVFATMPVTLDPDAAAIYKAFQEAGRPAYETLTAPEAREYYRNARVVMNPEPPALESNKPLSIPAPHGAIPARIYTPKTLRKNNGLAPCLVFFHGGGWVIGDLDTHEVACQKLAHEGELIVISVDYRLAPEHKFPAAVDDAITATKWVAANASQLGIDAGHLLVGGDSAGGNLAAVVALAARDGDGPKLAGQVLVYPATDFAMKHPSHSEPETSILLTHSVIKWFCNHYLNGAADIDHWKASPARAKTLAGLPPAYVLTAGADPLRDEGDEYAARLKEAGVPMTYRHFPGQFHGFFTMGKLLQQANIAVSEIAAWLKALK